ncbi:tail length tape-measure protein [Kochikohdavirus PBEF19]|uniref:Tail length tape-measure protein n=1 Tax=Enterococcus phage PBEF129 TaxID=2696337 RepID=A0A6B9SUB7_9CAUD|nr:tail length tape-measure protein [Enterococcus phage PBEF129]
MEYTENDLKVGTKLRCTKAKPVWWTVGKVYDVSLGEDGVLIIIDDNGHSAYVDYMLYCLNGKHNPVAFEIIKEEKEMSKYVEVTSLLEYTPDEEVIDIGKKYEVVSEEEDGVYIYANESQPKYFIYNKQFKFVKQNDEEKEFVEQNEEEKEMPKYAKITKYAGFNEIDKRNGLEIGKTYKIVSYDNALTNDCRIYLNDKHPRYFISETQYELVEKEHPVADVKVDVKEAIQAKIDALTTEAERLFTKRDRLEEHAINLNAKARRLEEVIKTIEEFE